MSTFEDVIADVYKALVQGPIGVDDMNAGDAFVERPDKHYGRDQYEDDEGLDKSVVPQHYVPAYGRVELLYKALPSFGAVIKADDVIRDEYTDRDIVVAGYASPQVVDREKHLITKEGMIKDLPRFLAEPMFSNAMILHSNVQVGVVLPEWTHPETGKVYKTSVDDIGLFVLIKIRTDRFRPKIIDKVIEDIEKGNLKAFSISGDAPVDSREHKCADGECFWVIPTIEFYEITICEEGVNQGAKLMILNKGCPDGKCGLLQKQPVPEGVDTFDEPNPIPIETVEKEAEETKEELSERVGEVAAEVGEAEVIEMVEDAEDAAKKLEKVGSGLGSGGSGDANTMADFGKPYNSETALAMKGGDPSIDYFFQAYRKHLARGASPEDSYFKLLDEGEDGQPAPKWFGTRDDKFRQFLIMANRSGLPIPTIRLRVIGNREGEIAADPSMTAWDLLQTTVNRMRGRLDKDVSPVEHHDHEDGGKRLPYVPSGQIDTRGMPKQEPYPGEAEESEEWYLNLSVNKGTIDRLKAIPLMAKAEAMWTAALTDGEGSIYVQRNHNVGKADVFSPGLSIVMTSEAMLNRFVEVGGTGKVRKTSNSATSRRQLYKVQLVGPPAAFILHQIEPHLIEKKAQARVALEVQRRNTKQRATTSSLAAKMNLHTTIKALNQGAVSPNYVLDALAKHCKGSGEEYHIHPPDFEDFSEACDTVRKHKDRMGSTAHHKTGSPQGGIAQPPQTAPRQQDLPEERVKTLTRLVKERNMNGARLRLVPGYRNQPYSVNGLDEIRQPVRLMGNVAEVTAALAEGKREVEELQARKMDNYAVPVEVGVADVKIYEGDDVDPMEMVREQVARASFGSAVAKVLDKRGTGWGARDNLGDEKQQVEPENVSVMGGIRDSQSGHANTEIISETDIQDIAGVGQEIEQVPEMHGIAQQGSVHPPRGVQGDGSRPEFVQDHEGEEGGIAEENEGASLSPEADEDIRGAPVAHRSQRP